MKNLNTHTVYLGLGSNLGDKEEHLRTALREIEKRIGKVTSLSAFHHTEPWGFQSEHTFLNAACAAETLLAPLEVLKETQRIERELGRTRKSVEGAYSDRPIDIDLLMYDDVVTNLPELTLPHPLMLERSFVMEPLAEIAPETVHPLTGKRMKDYT